MGKKMYKGLILLFVSDPALVRTQDEHRIVGMPAPDVVLCSASNYFFEFGEQESSELIREIHYLEPSFGKDTITVAQGDDFVLTNDPPKRYRPERRSRMKRPWKRRKQGKRR